MTSTIKTSFWQETKISHWLMILIIVTLGLLNFFFGERVPAGGGLGWDGVLYADMVRNLDKMLRDGLLSGYYAQRILPSAVVRELLLLSGAELSDTNIIRGFEIYNLALLVVACLVWRKLSDHFSITLGGRWLGFGGLFLSFQCAKQTFYYPVLTDTTALFVGLLLLFFYIEKRPIALLATAVLGAFAWQITGICGAMLLFLMKTNISESATVPSPLISSARFSRIAKFTWWASLILSFAGFGVLVLLGKSIDADRWHAWHLTDIKRVLTTLPSVIGMSYALVMLVGSMTFVRTAVRPQKVFLVMLSLVVVLVPGVLVRIMANPALTNIAGIMSVFRQMLLPPSGKFLLPLVTHAVFWGPMVLLLVLNWREFCLEARKIGPGFVAVIAISLPLSLATEPRYITLAWPFFVLGGVLAIERATVGASFIYLYAVITVLFAQFWLIINLAPWSPGAFENLDLFPKQLYFMHYGLWMSWWPYVIQLGVIVLCAMWLRRMLNVPHAGRSAIE